MADSNPSLVFTWTVKDVMTSLSLVLLYIATVESGWEWEQEDEIVVPIPPRLILADPRSSKIPPIVPSLLLKRPQGEVFFNFFRLEPGRFLNLCWSSSILLEDTFNVLACARYRENSTRSKERENPILTKTETNTLWLEIFLFLETKLMLNVINYQV